MTGSTSPTRLALFCKVVDNYGDIGICWRLARQWRHEHGLDVTLWVDDLASFQRLCPAVDRQAAQQQLDGVRVRHWAGQDGVFAPAEVAEIVIEFFAVDIPPGYIDAMAQCTPRPVWLNLEGLSAEQWVEGCHGLPSMHPRLPLTKHFFFPGFSARTGGLLREPSLLAQRAALDRPAFLRQLGAAPAELTVSLFCYPHAPVAALLSAWEVGEGSVTCLVPDGVASEAVAAFLGAPATPGATATRAALTVQVLPFLPQPDYDRLLWACDLNFVRGEDSFVRAQWAGQPFVWHIYHQDDDLHLTKLRAFLARYASGLPALSALALAWNGAAGQAPDWGALWAAFRASLAAQASHSATWQQEMLGLGDLAGNVIKFADARMAESRKTQV